MTFKRKFPKLLDADSKELDTNSLFMDDSLNTLRLKLHVYHNLPAPQHLYIWGKRKLHNATCQGFASITAAEIVRGRPIVQANEAYQTVASIFQDAKLVAPKQNHGFFHKNEVLQLILKTCTSSIAQSISVRYTDQGYNVHIPPNPLKMDSNTAESSWLQRNYEIAADDTLEGIGTFEELYVITFEQVKRHFNKLKLSNAISRALLMMYFPSYNTPFDVSKNDIKNLKQIDAFIGKVTTTDQTHVHEKLYLRSFKVHHNSLLNNSHVDLDRVFHSITLDSNVVYASLIDPISVLHKVYKKAFNLSNTGKGLPITVLKSWMDSTSSLIGKSMDSVLRLFVRLHDSVQFVRLDVHTSLNIDISFSFDITDQGDLEQINNSFDPIVKCLNTLQNALPKGCIISPLTKDILLGVQDGSLANIGYNAWFTVQGATPTLDRIRTVVSSMKPFFAIIIDEKDPKTILLQFKRHGKYEEQDAVMQFLNANYLLDETEVIPQLIRLFEMSQEEASQTYANWMDSSQMSLRRYNNGAGAAFAPYSMCPGICIRITSTHTGAAASVTGITHLAHVHIINAALRYALRIASTNDDLPQFELSENSNSFDKTASSKYPSVQDVRAAGMQDWTTGVSSSLDDDSLIVDDDLLADLERDTQNDNIQKSVGHVRTEDLSLIDPRLFLKGKYSTVCGRGRQPVAMTEEQRQHVQSQYPDSDTGALKIGNYYYSCPRIWCPKSHVSMSAAQFAASKNQCPIKGEEPVFRQGRDIFIGVHDPQIHPEGLTMPCCFKIPQRGWKWVSEEQNVNKTRNEERYIRALGFPTPAGRLSTLPPSMSKFLNNFSCGSRPDGSGLVGIGTNCFVRIGLPVTSNADSLVQSIAHLLRMNDTSTLCATLVKHLTMARFLSLNFGKVLRTFSNLTIAKHVTFPSFQKWFSLQKEYHDRFSINHLVKQVSQSTASNASDEVLREFMYYTAFENFRQYLLDPSIPKQPRYILPIVRIVFNEQILIIETEPTGEISLTCDETDIVPIKPLMIIIKQSGLYEPVIRVRWNAVSKSVEHETKTWLQPNTIVNMIAFQQNCRKALFNNSWNLHKQSVIASLKHLGVEHVYAQVIDPFARLRGYLLTKKGPYVPIPTIPMQSYELRMPGKILHLSQVLDFLIKSPHPQQKTIITKLSSLLGNYYQFREHLQTIVLQDGTTLPIKKGLNNPLLVDAMKIAMMDQTIAAKSVVSTSTDVKFNQKAAHELLLEHTKDLFETALSSQVSTMESLYYLRHPLNPLPASMKQTQLERLIERTLGQDYKKKIAPFTQGERARIAKSLLHGFDFNAPSLSLETTQGAHDQIVLLHSDIKGKSEKQLGRLLQNVDSLLTNNDIDKIVVEMAARPPKELSPIVLAKQLSNIPSPTSIPGTVLQRYHLSMDQLVEVLNAATLLFNPWISSSISTQWFNKVQVNNVNVIRKLALDLSLNIYLLGAGMFEAIPKITKNEPYIIFVVTKGVVTGIATTESGRLVTPSNILLKTEKTAQLLHVFQ
jgi:hypothetical protein